MSDLWTDVRSFGAIGNGVFDNTTAIQAAIDSLPSGGIVMFPPGWFKITAPVNILRNKVWLVGSSPQTTIIKLGAPESKIKIGSDFVYRVGIKNLAIDGDNRLAIRGIELNKASNTQFENVDIMACQTAVSFSDVYCSVFGNIVYMSRCNTCWDIVSGCNITMCNSAAFDNKVVFDFGTVYMIRVRDSFFEKFDTLALCDHTRHFVSLQTAIFEGNYFLSTQPNNRVFLSSGATAMQGVNSKPVIFNQNHAILFNTDYLAEVAWGSEYSPSNRIKLLFDQNHLYIPDKMKYWFHSDVTNPTCVEVEFGKNYSNIQEEV